MFRRVTPETAFARRWLGLLFVSVSLLVISLDNTVLNIALPSISRTLNASLSELQWIVDAYILVFAALLLTLGGLGDRIGRKRALQFGLVMFGLGSLAAGLSTSTNLLIASRAFLGIGGATIMPATLSIVSATFPAEERPRAIASWAAVFGLGVGIGPLIGGWLLERFEWNSVFFINLPVIVVALIGGALTLGESRDEHAPKVDLPGVLLSIGGLFSLVFGIIRAGQESWTDTSVLIAFGMAVVLLGIFAWWESRNSNAMLPISLFRNPSFTAANVALTFASFSMFGSLFFVSQYLQTVQGYPTLEAGVRLLPMALVLAFVASQSSRISARLGTKYTVSLGLGLAALALFSMSQLFMIDTPYLTIAFCQILLATGMGLAFSPATNSIMASVPVNKAGIGSAMNDTTRQLGGALGIAVLGTIMNNTYRAGVSSLPQTIQIPDMLAKQAEQAFDAISSGIQAAHIVADRIGSNLLVPAGTAQKIITVADQSYVNGMDRAMLIGAVMMALAAVFTLVFLPSRVHRVEEINRLPSSDPLPAVSGD